MKLKRQTLIQHKNIRTEQNIDMAQNISHIINYLNIIFLFQNAHEKVTSVAITQGCTMKNLLPKYIANFREAPAMENLVIGYYPRPATLPTKELHVRCFPVNFAKRLTTPLQDTPKRLLLENKAHLCQGLKVIHSGHMN